MKSVPQSPKGFTILLALGISLFLMSSLASNLQGQEWKVTTGLSQPRAKGARKNPQRDRKEATVDALRDACEQLGVKISSLTEVKNYVTNYDLIKSEANQFIEFERVNEVYREDGVMQVTIKYRKKETSVSPEEQNKAIRDNQAKPSEPKTTTQEAPSKQLIVKIVRGINMSGQNIFVNLSIGVETEERPSVGRTEVVQNANSPEWNKTFTVPSYNGKPIHFDVFNNNGSNIQWVGNIVLNNPQSGTYEIKRQGEAGNRGQLEVSFESK
jgi:hypothetical protein